MRVFPRSLLALLTPCLALSAQGTVLESSMLAGLRYRTIGPATMSGRVTDLAVLESDPGTFYVASATGGVWKTTDHGTTIAPVFENQAVHSVGALGLFQPNPAIVWVGTGEATNRQSSGWGDGIYKSTDAGKTWANMGLRESAHIARIVTHPTNPDVVFVAVPGKLWAPSKERGLYRTTDGGNTWALTLAIDENTGVSDVALDPSDPMTVYAVSYQRRRQAFGFNGGGPGSALWKSTDGGTTWRKIMTGLPTGIVGRIGVSVYRKNPNVVYVSVEQGVRYTSSVSYEQRRGGIYRSADKGETWRFMGDWNPRPAYSSKLLVDPSDERRLYQVQYSVSDDSGKTWREPRQTLHGDDRIIWVDPRDSRHVIKGDDGGVGVSYDRGVKWLYQRALPVGQFYHIGLDNSSPFRICGGMQDNNAWCGPSANYFSDGVLNEDFFLVGGGDGFQTQFDTTNNRTLYVSSQYLGLTRVDLKTSETRNIRPMWPEGDVYKRGNWGPPVPLVGRYQEGANWNAPLIVSAFNPRVLYAGMRHLYKSTDRGETWKDLGDLTTKVNRRSLPIMGELPDSLTLSLDDGVSFYPTVSALAESPKDAKTLYAGTDDGNLHVSRDGGASWTSLMARVPAVPKGTWVGLLEASRHTVGTVFVSFDGHQNGDFHNYLFRSTDFGQQWVSIAGNLPADVVPKVLHEDQVNPNLLFLGTEFGMWISIDAGAHWVELKNNLPRVPVNDLVVHARDKDLVLGTHGRGIWILDNINALRELTPQVLASTAHLFSMEPAQEIRYKARMGHTGDQYFRGTNPAPGAIIDFWSKDSGAAVLRIRNAKGVQVSQLAVAAKRGVNRALWSLRGPSLPGVGGTDDEGRESRPISGHFVAPGTYTVELTLGGATSTGALIVREDPRQDAPVAVRKAWSDTLEVIATLYRNTARLERAVRGVSAGNAAHVALADTLAALQQRVGALYGGLQAQVGAPTADMRAQLRSFSTRYSTLEPRATAAAPSSAR